MYAVRSVLALSCCCYIRDGASKEISELDFLETSELTGQALAPYTDAQSGDLTMYTLPPMTTLYEIYNFLTLMAVADVNKRGN